MNIVLVDACADKNFVPLGYHPHPGLAYIAACLQEQGHALRIVDPVSSKNNMQEMIRQIADFKPRIVGFTATTAARFQAIAVINSVKEKTGAFIAAGGCHFHPTAIDAMSKFPAIDCIVKGEGESAMVEIARAVEAGESLSKINGIFFRENGGVSETADRPVNNDLDSLPRPAYHLFNLKRYKISLPGEKRIPALGVISSRGCPCKCIFCSSSALKKHNFRRRSPGLFLDEIAYLQETYGYKNFLFHDDTITMDRSHIVDICNGMLKRKMNIRWLSLARVNTVDRDLLSLMKSAGCSCVVYGIESGSDVTLRTLKKGATVEQGVKAIEMTAAAGIPFAALFMVSLPGETLPELQKTIDLINRFSAYPGSRVSYSFTAIYPGTELEALAYKDGILPKDFSWNMRYAKPVYAILGTDPYTPCWENPSLPFEEIKAAIFKSKPFLYKIRQIVFRLRYISLRNIIFAIRVGIRSLTPHRE